MFNLKEIKYDFVQLLLDAESSGKVNLDFDNHHFTYSENMKLIGKKMTRQVN